MTTSKELTPLQAETLAFVTSYVTKHGYSPTVAEMADAAKVCQNAMCERIAALVRKGAITKAPGIARSIRPVASA